LSHCCIDEFPLQILLRNLRHLKTLKYNHFVEW
jgi:hypothetical protein